jgi:hemerythrin
MTRVGYTGVDEHRHEHVKFINQVSRFMRLYRRDALAVIIKFHDVCDNWYHRHMTTMDNNMASFIMSCDIQKQTAALSSTFLPFVERDGPVRQPPDLEIEWLG